jgi:hypothetical protein
MAAHGRSAAGYLTTKGLILMRLRAAAAAIGATAVFLALPGAGNAAEGTLSYQYDDGVHTRSGTLENPRGKACARLNLPNPSIAAHHVDNRTNGTAVVFLDDHCSSDNFYIVPPGKRSPARVLVRSVLFSQ